MAVSTIYKENENDTGWIVYRPEWYNDRVMETYISSPVIDKQNDKIPTETIKESMDFYMKYGVYSYRHEEQPIGLPLAYQIKEGKVKVRVGIHDKLSMHNKVWKEIQEFGSNGASSIRGEAMDQEKVCDEEKCHNQINELDLWSVSWVGDNPANPEATVRDVAMAKAKSDTIQVTLDQVEGMVEKIIERRGKEYCLLGKKDRKVLGCHDSRAGAVRQERAIQARRFSKSNELLDDILKTIRKEPCWSGYEMVGFKYQGGRKVPNCVPIAKAEYQGRKVQLNKPFRLSGEKKKFGVYVKNSKNNVVVVKFGDPKMDIKRDDPEKRRQFRARHNCDSPGPKDKARYWSCKMWSKKNVSDILGKAETMTTVKTDSLKKTNDHLNDIMRMIKHGVYISKKKTPGKVWFDNCRANVRRIERMPGRRNVRDERAFCSELWYNPGRFDQTYSKPGGGTGRTSGMQFRLDMGTSTGPSGLKS